VMTASIRDGCLFFEYPGGKYRAFFIAFQSQSFQTDDKTGHAKTVDTASEAEESF